MSEIRLLMALPARELLKKFHGSNMPEVDRDAMLARVQTATTLVEIVGQETAGEK